jgi:type II secretory ATPase GspE/PulE/Tfp pilus assembly ATPase PilB-like protein
LNRPDRKIITAEDPVEYYLPGINQCEVKHSIGLDFARIIRAMMRQAPNVILVGEMRDQETASMGIQASLTGHLVFSTLHTNDAPSAITRMIDMGTRLSGGKHRDRRVGSTSGAHGLLALQAAVQAARDGVGGGWNSP